MKLTKVISLLCVLTLLFAFVGCDDPAAAGTTQPDGNNTGTNQQTPSEKEPEYPEEAYSRCLSIYAAKGDPVLPTGTGKTILEWSAPSAGGITGLPANVLAFDGQKVTTSKTNVTAELKAALKTAQETPGFFAEKPRNVILIISDGMGEPQVKMSREYKGELISDYIAVHRSADHRAFAKGTSEDASKTELTNTDSCAGGTAMLTGYKTRYGYIAMDRDANQIPTLAELAKKNKMKVGCVTNDCTTDATPADTLCHSTVRSSGDCLDIQDALFGADVVIGGYTAIDSYVKEGKFLDKVASRKDSDEAYDMSKKMSQATKVTTWWEQYKSGEYGNMFAKMIFGDDKYFADKDAAWFTKYFADQNYKYSTSMTQLLKTKANEKAIMNVGQASPSWPSKTAMGFLLKGSQYPNFPEMVAYTITQLEAQDLADGDTDGFFCMIENTVTDGWGHLSDAIKTSLSPASDGQEPGIKNENVKAAYIANEVQNTDEGVAVAIKYVLEHPDTLLVVSADHDTGGLKFLPGWEENYDYVVSSTSGHSDALVPVWALGPGAELFTKDLKGNDIAEITVKQIMGADGDTLLWTPTSTDYINYYTGAKIGELMGDPNFGCRQGGDPRYGGYDDIPKK